MKGPRIAMATVFAMGLLMLLSANSEVAAATPSMSVTPPAAVVGGKISIAGSGYPSDTPLTLEWETVNASWVVTGNPPQVEGVNVLPTWSRLATVETGADGSFSATATVPKDFGGLHVIQASLANGTAIPGRAIFTLEPSFEVSPASGPAGSPIEVTATGLGYGEYSTSYHLYWDNSYVGYFTAISSRGATNFTIYASGTPGTHYVGIYQGYPGPGYLNPQQGPPSSETQSNFPPYIPFRSEFNITGSLSGGSTTGSTSAQSASLVILAASLTSVGLLVVVAVGGPPRRNGVVKTLAAVVIVAAVVVAGVSAYVAFAPGGGANGANYVPQEAVVRPTVSVPQNNATSGPRISVAPDVASVGENVTVTGAGFEPGAVVPLSWTTMKGSNLLGYEPVAEPLRTVTVNSDGTFSFTMQTPPDLGGLHFISSGTVTERSNGTLFIQRTASINATQGPLGTVVAITMLGVGWTFNTNIAALDYDNTYIGYGCGFNSGGNVTLYLTVTGAPGIHTIDIYPSVWWGASNYYNQSVVEYRYPLLTPQDHPQLMPSFHFSFLITDPGSQSQGSYSIFSPIVLTLAGDSLFSASPSPLHATRAEVRGGQGAGI